ncbi:MAG: DUF4837 family protein [Prevotellaceae bacterium]|nr:DUF4837 family protein [Prevotellaceae bacterium]
MKHAARYRICAPPALRAGWIGILAAVCLAACSGGNQLLPEATGRDGEMITVIDNRLWHDTTLRRMLHDVAASGYPALPQHEPLFDVIEIKGSLLTHLLRTHRNMLILQVADSMQSGVSLLHNKWATAQSVVLVRAHSAAAMTDLLLRQREQIAGAAAQADRRHAVAALKRHGNTALRDTLNRLFGGSPWFTGEYVLRKKTPHFAWIEFEPSDILMGIFIYRRPYSDSAAFLAPNMVAARNDVLRREVPGQFDGTYMITSPLMTPQLQHVHHRHTRFVEMRGWWDMHDDYMGGPFVSHSFIAPSRHEMITLEAFVYNPHGEKSRYLRRLEAVLHSFEMMEREK